MKDLFEAVQTLAEEEVIDDLATDGFVHHEAVQEGFDKEFLLFYYVRFCFGEAAVTLEMGDLG